ncbi:unnamed protein product [Rotaria sp. Silwood2]|nr:unnamed protein product [Rotaria sp. Silwood2]CAF2502397.1 unnamed protein product [Rotaria sp. Silwood2]CAF2732982.1 unnamed protein product [Rotaria sp. Silwood2]CAF2965450.1 unnamed protein product [Rotaria sp. Silwood2]
MILSASTEFDRTRNPIIIDRPSDNTELPKLFRELPDAQEKTKERPFQAPYSIKARTLLHAHLQRLNTLSDNLEKDKRYVVRRSIYLINEMINIEAQLVAMGHAGRLKNAPRLDTIENTMKLSSMLIQALLNTKSSLLQLPHITESQLRFFETKKRTIKSIRQFVAMDDEQRRSMLRSITDEQYYDIMNVLAIYPHITMNITCGVFDDEDEHIITTGAVVTLTVHLHRENMSSLFSKEINTNTFAVVNTLDDAKNDEQIDDKENRDKTNGTLKMTATCNASKGWNNKSEKKKKANKDKGKKKGHSISSKTNNISTNKQALANTNNIKNKIKNDTKDSGDSLLNIHRRREQAKRNINESDNELNSNNNDENENLINDQTIERSKTSSNKTKTQHNDNEEDKFLERFQQQQRKREKLETKAKVSHRVFCPFYSEIKQECWWLYVADRKNYSLISAPIYLCTLKDDEEIEVKFSAPKVPGHYVYSVILRSDSYFDVDVMENLSLDVQAAKEVVDNHPQWDFSDDDGKINNKVEDDEFTTESDSDKD